MAFFQRFIFLIIPMCFINVDSFAADYKIAVRAHHGIEDAYRQWQPTVDALLKSMPEHSFVLTPIVSLNEISERIGKEEFDFVLTNPSSFIEVEVLYGAKALVTLNNKRANKAQDRFGSVIFTHVENKDILSIKDLQGKTLMAVSEPAFGGWRVAWLEMLDQGFDPYTDLKILMFTDSGIQPDVVRAVSERKVEVGVVRTDHLEHMEDDGEIDMRYFRIINNKEVEGFPFFLSTPLYPEWVFASTNNAPKEVQVKVQQALLVIHPATEAAKAGKYMGWVEPLDYKSVRKLMRRLKVGPYASSVMVRDKHQ